jgi:hypothetical protein
MNQMICGAVAVAVATLSAAACSNTAPTHVPGLSITSVTPASGPASGGTIVTISGHNFGSALGVTFGSLPAAHVQVVESTRAVATTPPHAPGVVDVGVVTGGTSVALRDAFTFVN